MNRDLTVFTVIADYMMCMIGIGVYYSKKKRLGRRSVWRLVQDLTGYW